MDIQAVILAAGRGSRLAPLSDDCYKCLLPIANVPMLWYPLRSCDLAGFKDVTILVNQSRELEVKKALQIMQEKVPWRTDGFTYSFVQVPDIADEGTYTSLLRAAHPKKDLLVLSCDVITNVPLTSFISTHRRKNSSLTCLFKTKSKPEGPVPGMKSKSTAKDSTVIGVDEAESRLLFIYSQADYESLPLSLNMLNSHPDMIITSQLEDSHLYLISRAALSSIKTMSSLEFEVVPQLVADQFAEPNESQDKEPDELFDFSRLTMEAVHNLAGSFDNKGDTRQVYRPSGTKCLLYKSDNNLCVRVSTTADFYEANKHIAAHDCYFGLSDFHKNPSGFKRSQVGNDSTVGNNLKMADKSCVKKSAIGNNCVIGDNVKINNSVIFDNVVIKDGSVVQTCIVCEGVTVEEKCELKECIVGAKQSVEARSKMSNEVMARDSFDEF